MPIPTPFHERTAARCGSLRWKDWAGYHAVCYYGDTADAEYYALRHAAGLIDVSPLYKYRIHGPEAAGFLAYATVRDATRLRPGRVSYSCWCDDSGKVIDDGTVARLSEAEFRLTAAEPSLAWLQELASGFAVRIEDVSQTLAALALQGPCARSILRACVADADVAGLPYFALTSATIAGKGVTISRTGYTGDLGYEIWMAAADAVAIYDALQDAGEPHQLLPCGLDAMDVARIEAGFIMNGVDYHSAHHALIAERQSSPFELGLARVVELERDPPFVGQAALRRERARAAAWRLVYLDVDWPATEALFDNYGLPPEVGGRAWRDGKPVYDADGSWIGMATSGAWSPTLKKNLAIAQLPAALAQAGARVAIEQTVQYRRHTVPATVCLAPLYDPPRKRAPESSA